MRGVLLILAYFLSINRVSAQKCFYPDGTESPNDVACKSTSSGYSACCGKTASCLSSGLCLDKGVVSRGSCTDSQFKDAACPQYCRDVYPSAGCAVVPRAVGPTVADYQWCCDFPNSAGQCKSGSSITVQAGDVIAKDTSVSSTSSGTTSATGSPTNNASSNTSPTSCSPTTSATGECIAPERFSTVVTGVGAGVGVPLGIAVVSLLFLWLRERRRRKNGEAGLNMASTNQILEDKQSAVRNHQHGSYSPSETLTSTTAAPHTYLSGKGARPELSGSNPERPELP